MQHEHMQSPGRWCRQNFSSQSLAHSLLVTHKYMEGGRVLMVLLVSGATGSRIRMATNTARPTDICRACPADVTLSCTQHQPFP